jgi:chromosome segregation ATPase
MSTSSSQTKAGNRSPGKQQQESATSTTTTTTITSILASSKTPQQHQQQAPPSIYVQQRNGANTSRSSPVSPTRITRLQEKEEMQNLNDRLVIYIDTVRRLESENNRLQSIVLSYNENSTRDVSEIKRMYEQELEDAKRLIDDLAKEKARFEIDINKYKSDAEEIAAKLAKREKEFKQLENKYKTADSEKIEYKSRYDKHSCDLICIYMYSKNTIKINTLVSI